MAFELFDGAAEEQLKAIEGAVLRLARADTSLQSSRSWGPSAGSGRQGGFLLKPSHGFGWFYSFC